MKLGHNMILINVLLRFEYYHCHNFLFIIKFYENIISTQLNKIQYDIFFKFFLQMNIFTLYILKIGF